MIVLLKNNSSSKYIACIIYNERQRLHHIALGGRSLIICLMKTIHVVNYYFTYQCNIDNKINSLFFVHSNSVGLAKRYISSIVMDSTYKINRFRILILYIIEKNIYFF